MKKEIAAHEKKNKTKLFPGRLIGDEDGEQFKRLAEFAAKHGHEESLSEYISPAVYKHSLIRWRQQKYKARRAPRSASWSSAHFALMLPLGSRPDERSSPPA